jgi:hypothetical protein
MAFSNAGALLEFGKVSGVADTPAAAALYREGARYGDAGSIAGLERLGQPVPAVDRVAPDIAERRQQQLDFALLVTGIMVQRDTSTPAAPAIPVLLPVHTRITPPATASMTPGPSCRYPADCRTGQSCVVPEGQVSGVGICAVSTLNGMPAVLAPRITPTLLASCQFNTQCPLTFKCERVRPSDLNGLCVGPASAATRFQH